MEDDKWSVAKTPPRRHDGYQEVLIVAGKQQIAVMRCEDAESKAHVMAAALDLLAALERKLELDTDHRRFDLAPEKRGSHRAWLDEVRLADEQARAAIAKARGA